MLHLIKPNTYNLYRKDLDNMYRLRHRVFCTKLNWDVNSHDGMEKDQYDEKNAYYTQCASFCTNNLKEPQSSV
jgi:N-acyl-L-homoserine lactone synthetase